MSCHVSAEVSVTVRRPEIHFAGNLQESLETFKKSRQGVKTPVWFVLHTHRGLFRHAAYSASNHGVRGVRYTF